VQVLRAMTVEAVDARTMPRYRHPRLKISPIFS
jgi:hypothetical protein